MNLPSREECERWDQARVAAFLCTNNMQECAATVHRLNINGQRLLSLTDSEISKFSLVHQPQLQKMIQDIKKSDDSLLNKLRRLKSKPLPKVPARDYRDEEHLPESYHPRHMYEEPPEEQDDNYEPPPSHTPLATANSASFSGEEYLDNRHSLPHRPPKKPVFPPRNASRPQRARVPDLESDEDYIDPDDTHTEDNYVEPAEGPDSSFSDRSPNTQKRLFSLPGRPCTLPQSQFHSLPWMSCPRMNMRRSPTCEAEPTSDEEYEVCDPGGSSHQPAEALRLPPKPLPRERSPKPALKPRPDLKSREFENRLLPAAVQPEPQKALTPDPRRPQIPPHFASGRKAEAPAPTAAPALLLNPAVFGPAVERRGAPGWTEPDKDQEIRNKHWYGGACDRKTADEALLRSNQDGAFMVRKSSGQDAQQPYTLVVFYNGRVYNIPVRFIAATQQYALGREKSGEEYFNSLPHIIENHQRTPLVLIDGQNNTKDTTRLSYPVRPHGWNADE
ncbi:B-cell linker protein isoform X2 [Takifugu rubripes]|uniref:B-cell linker protein isoform X2 n=1 Tax=Takifugu rubripes TaxID=31033 RepID=UPI0005D25E0D|nr:B-cell linker protein isoform X2 [Takifugu rubripes]|eukprot:XP_011601160.1 PREDICTED: B-cell linker protein isoform X1 [Takifugu rubripes]